MAALRSAAAAAAAVIRCWAAAQQPPRDKWPPPGGPVVVPFPPSEVRRVVMMMNDSCEPPLCEKRAPVFRQSCLCLRSVGKRKLSHHESREQGIEFEENFVEESRE